MLANLKYAIVTLGCLIAVIMAGCQEPLQSAEDVRAARMAGGLAPADILDAVVQDGGKFSELLAAARKIDRNRISKGDDDMPNITSSCSEMTGPPQVEDYGCDSYGVCIRRFTYPGTRCTFWLVEDGGSAQWYGPQGCPNCAP